MVGTDRLLLSSAYAIRGRMGCEVASGSWEFHTGLRNALEDLLQQVLVLCVFLVVFLSQRHGQSLDTDWFRITSAPFGTVRCSAASTHPVLGIHIAAKAGWRTVYLYRYDCFLWLMLEDSLDPPTPHQSSPSLLPDEYRRRSLQLLRQVPKKIVEFVLDDWLCYLLVFVFFQSLKEPELSYWARLCV